MRITPTIIFVLLYGFCSCNTPKEEKKPPIDSYSFQDDLGRTITIPNQNPVIVSLVPSITEIIYSIGAEEMLTAVSSACDFPMDGLPTTKIQTYPEIDFARLIQLKTDLCLASPEIIPVSHIGSFDNLGLNVAFFNFENIDDISRVATKIALFPNSGDSARILSEKLLQDFTLIPTKKLPSDKKRVAILVSISPIIVAGGKGYLNDLIEKAGGENIFSDHDKSYVTLNPELLIQKNPEMIIVAESKEEGYAKILNLVPMASEISAIKSKNVIEINPDLLFRPGPRSVGALRILSEKFGYSNSFVEPINE